MVMPYHLHMPSYFLETFTEYPELYKIKRSGILPLLEPKPGLEPGTYSLRMNCSTN